VGYREVFPEFRVADLLAASHLCGLSIAS
jgi:hypothetical protein